MNFRKKKKNRKSALILLCIILVAPMLSSCWGVAPNGLKNCYTTSNPIYVGASTSLLYKPYSDGEEFRPEDLIDINDPDIEASSNGGNLQDYFGSLIFFADEPGTYKVTIKNNSLGFNGGSCSVEITVLESELVLQALPPKILPGGSSEISIDWKGNFYATSIYISESDPTDPIIAASSSGGVVPQPFLYTVSPVVTTT